METELIDPAFDELHSDRWRWFKHESALIRATDLPERQKRFLVGVRGAIRERIFGDLQELPEGYLLTRCGHLSPDDFVATHDELVDAGILHDWDIRWSLVVKRLRTKEVQ